MRQLAGEGRQHAGVLDDTTGALLGGDGCKCGRWLMWSEAIYACRGLQLAANSSLPETKATKHRFESIAETVLM
jgi:hypothetical protein